MAVNPKKRLCYVIMPFSKHVGIDEDEWTSVYENIFKPAIEGAGFKYRCERSEIAAGAFTKEIVENMKNAHLVVADITGFNGNVMWELGVRHALSTKTIMVARNKILDEKVISDLKIYGVHTYENNASGIVAFKKKIKANLKKIEENPDKPDNPVFDFLKIEDLVLNSFERKITINRLVGFLNELLENLRLTEGINSGTFRVEKKFVTYKRLKTNAYNYLLTTNYHIFNNSQTTDLHAIISWMDSMNFYLDQLDNALTTNSTEEYLEKIVKEIMSHNKTNESKIQYVIELVSDEISSLKQSKLRNYEPSIVYFEPKHKKLVDRVK